jgi:phosphatidylserine decarboxylase
MSKACRRRSPGMECSPDAIDFLRGKAATDSNFLALLLASLQRANNAAQTDMDAQLRSVLAWPTDLAGYLEYLAEFSRWAPQQSDNPGWADPDTGFSQEVYDHLCHFYYLIDQPVGADGATMVQDIDWFSQWLVDFADLWGSFLNTPDSFSDAILQTYIDYSPYFRVQDSMVDGKPNKPGGWNSFNEFFARELNPGLRPIASPGDNSVITLPADCTYRMQYPISPDSQIPQITIKKTHQFATIPELLEGSKYANAFANGTFVHYFLGPYSYHRFHTPVAGTLEECYAVQGLTFLEVNLVNGQFDAPDNSGDDPSPGTNSGEGYEFTQARGVLTIDTTNSPHGDMGIVAVIPVGMCQVSSVNMTATPGPVAKGDEFGYFLFGGSDIILLFQEGKAPKIDTCNTYRYYGTDIGTCPDSAK